MIVYSWLDGGTIQHHDTLRVEGNVIDVAILQAQMSILYTIDNLEEYSSATSKQLRHNPTVLGSYCYSVATQSWIKESLMQESVDGINEWAVEHKSAALDPELRSSDMREYLYGTERLRKRGQDED